MSAEPVESSGIDAGAGRQAIERAFLAGLRQRRLRDLLALVALNFLGIGLFLVAWEVLPRVVPDVNILMFPPPSLVIDSLWPLLASGELVGNILVSLRRALLGSRLPPCWASRLAC